MARPKLLFLGLDSAEPTLLERWADAGELPGLAGVIEESAKVAVTVPEGFANGCAWPSLYTGVNPGRHGRYSSATWARGSYDYRVSFDEDQHLQARPFWTSLSERGVSVGVVDMVRSPLTPSIKGFQIADWLTHDRRHAEPRSFPDALIRDVLRECGGDELGGSPENFLRGNTLAAFCDTLVARIQAKTSLTLKLASRFSWDLYMSVFGESHDAGHIFWRLHDRDHPDHDPQLAVDLVEPLKRVYRALDSALAQILHDVEADYKIIFAGPGMGPNYSANGGMADVLVAIAKAMKADSAARESGSSSLRSLARAVLPPPLRAALRRIAPRRVKDTWDAGDMQALRFFQVPHTGSAGAIRINLRGREPRGCIEPGQEYHNLCDELEVHLMRLVNAETDGPVVSKVVRVHATCSGAALDLLPDLLVVWDRSAPIRRVSLPGSGEFPISQPQRSGDHTPASVMYVIGPGIRSGSARRAVRVEDLAPTMVALLGMKPTGFDGQSVRELLENH